MALLLVRLSVLTPNLVCLSFMAHILWPFRSLVKQVLWHPIFALPTPPTPAKLCGGTSDSLPAEVI